VVMVSACAQAVVQRAVLEQHAAEDM
jgi:hypothetical protein